MFTRPSADPREEHSIWSCIAMLSHTVNGKRGKRMNDPGSLPTAWQSSCKKLNNYWLHQRNHINKQNLKVIINYTAIDICKVFKMHKLPLTSLWKTFSSQMVNLIISPLTRVNIDVSPIELEEFCHFQTENAGIRIQTPNKGLHLIIPQWCSASQTFHQLQVSHLRLNICKLGLHCTLLCSAEGPPRQQARQSLKSSATWKVSCEAKRYETVFLTGIFHTSQNQL